MTNRLTDEQIANLDRLEREATPGPWPLGVSETTSPEEVAEHLRQNALMSPGPVAWLLLHPNDYNGEAKIQHARAAASTGNGPTSEANARFLSAMRAAFRPMLDELRASRSAPSPEPESAGGDLSTQHQPQQGGTDGADAGRVPPGVGGGGDRGAEVPEPDPGGERPHDEGAGGVDRVGAGIPGLPRGSGRPLPLTRTDKARLAARQMLRGLDAPESRVEEITSALLAGADAADRAQAQLAGDAALAAASPPSAPDHTVCSGTCRTEEKCDGDLCTHAPRAAGGTPEPESAGARATAAEEVVNAAWELVSARNLDGSLQAKPTEVSRLKAALIRYRDAPAPRAAGGTTATDPEIGRLLDTLEAAVSSFWAQDPDHRERQGYGAAMVRAREAVEAAFRTIATERADALREVATQTAARFREKGRAVTAESRLREVENDHERAAAVARKALARAEAAEGWQLAVADALGFVNRAEGQSGYEVAEPGVVLDAYRSAIARAESAEARVSELTRERDLMDARWRNAARVVDETVARVSELEAALGGLAKEWENEAERRDRDASRMPRGGRLELRTGASFERDHAQRLRALASRPPAATEGGRY
jgi:hypothetical protein